MNTIRLVAGLGNPGPEYAVTRHNVGFMVVDQVAAQSGAAWERSTKWEARSAKCGDVLLVKPMCFMNRSGHPLFAIAQFYKIAAADIFVVLDDFALPLGRLRIRQSGGSGGHNGGQFTTVYDIATDSKGNIYAGETWEGKRVQRFLYKGLAPAR